MAAHLTRRSILAGAALAVAGAGLSLADDSVPLAAIDAHTHFYDPTRPLGVPWPDKSDKLLYRKVSPADFVALARPLGVVGTIVVEASPWLEDNQYLLDLAARDKTLLGIVGNLDIRDASFSENLKRFARNPLYRGIRVGGDVLIAAIDDPAVVKRLVALMESGLALDINGGLNGLRAAVRLRKALADLRIVINHVGNVAIDGKAPPDDWKRAMNDVADAKNTFCKISALMEGARAGVGNAPTELDFYRPVLDAVWSAFGADRVIYASNWPVCETAGSYAQVFTIAKRYLAERGRTVTTQFFHDNALIAYKPPA